jgi:hypothetical protein
LLQGVLRARVAELADAPHSKCGIERCVGSSPTSGTCFPCSGALWCFFRVDSVHTLASDLMFRVCGVPDRPIRLWGAADYGGPRTALWGPSWVFILVRPSVGFAFTLHGG